MRDLILIPDIVLRKSIRALNESGLTPRRNVISLTKGEMVKVFAYQVEQVALENVRRLPRYVVELYNYIFEDEAEVPSTIKRYMFMPKMSPFGSREGTQAYIMDEMFLKGGCTLEEVAIACNTTKRRVKNHMTHVRVKFNKKFVRSSDGKYYVKDNKDEQKKKIRRPLGRIL